MLFKLFSTFLVLTFSCHAMDCMSMRVKTTDNCEIVIPATFVPQSETLKGMLEDVGNNPNALLDIPLNSESLIMCLRLADIYTRESREKILPLANTIFKEGSILDVAQLLKALNYLNAKPYFIDVLWALSTKIHAALHAPLSNLVDNELAIVGQICSVANDKLWDELDALLPKALQRLVQKCLLCNHGLLKEFITELRIEKWKYTDPDYSKIIAAFDVKGKHLHLTFTDYTFKIFDLSQDRITHGLCYERDTQFSPNGLYISYLFGLGHVNLEHSENKRIWHLDGNNGKFTQDSKLFITDTNAVFDLENWKELSKNYPLTDEQKVPHKPRETYLGLGACIPDENRQLSFIRFSHPEFSKLNNQADVDTFCSQLPAEVLEAAVQEDFKLSISKNQRFAALRYKRQSVDESGNESLIDVLDVYNISDITTIVLLFSIEEKILGFALDNDRISIATKGAVNAYNLNEKSVVFSLPIDFSFIAFSQSGYSFITFTPTENGEQTKIKGYWFNTTLNDFFTFDFPSLCAGLPRTMLYSFEQSLFVKDEQEVEFIKLFKVPLKELTQKHSLKQLLVRIATKKCLQRITAADAQFGNSSAHTDDNDRPAKRPRRE